MADSSDLFIFCVIPVLAHFCHRLLPRRLGEHASAVCHTLHNIHQSLRPLLFSHLFFSIASAVQRKAHFPCTTSSFGLLQQEHSLCQDVIIGSLQCFIFHRAGLVQRHGCCHSLPLPLVRAISGVAHLAFSLLTVGCDRLGQLQRLVDGRSTAWCTGSADSDARSQCATTLQDATTSATEARPGPAGVRRTKLACHAFLFDGMRPLMFISFYSFPLYTPVTVIIFTNIILFSKLIHIQKLLG